MATSLECMELCRLCLVKEHVNVPIFKDGNDVQQIFLKITACLPVKVSREDKLPKNICNDCVCKVESFYQFWNTTANAEKQLLQWLGEVGDMGDKQDFVEVLNTNVMKQEQSGDTRLEGNFIQVGGQNNIEMTMIDNMSIITMPAGSEQQFTTVPMDSNGTVQTVQVVSGPSTQAAYDQSEMVEEVEESEEDDMDDGCDNEGLPVKEETEDDNGEQQTTYISVPVTCDEAGPSGLQQQKISELTEMTLQQSVDEAGDPKSGSSQRQSSKKRYQCPLCPESFAFLGSLGDHQFEHHKIARPFKCDFDGCKSEFRSSINFKRHKRNHSSVKKYHCDVCEYTSNQKFNMTLHTRRHAKDYKFKCEVCDRGFMQKTKWTEHMALHEGKGTSKCGVCNKVFNYKRNLVAHMRTSHQESLQAECTLCPRAFSNEQSLRRHVKATHEKVPQKHLCDLCGKQLSSKKALANHIRSHRGEKVRSCEICSKSFARNDNFKIHMRIHSGEKPYFCDICGRSFTQRTTLVHHIKYHTQEKEFRCGFCGKAFISAAIVRKHAKIHKKKPVE